MIASMFHKPVRLNNGTDDRDGCLLFFQDELICVLVQLSATTREETGVNGHWFIEAGFGPCHVGPAASPIFGTIDEVKSWAAKRLSCGRADADLC
ncbi:hypothetical protein [Methylobacterium sp. ID0610]|uniref:hypothetical protein n=1 Tax=Methylobacterium carpenticola TaxID=3344827 RepID=UPI0036A619F3